MAFDEWWESDGQYIDPDVSEVPWFDKREALARMSWDAAVLSRLPPPLDLLPCKSFAGSRASHTEPIEIDGIGYCQRCGLIV